MAPEEGLELLGEQPPVDLLGHVSRQEVHPGAPVVEVLQRILFNIFGIFHHLISSPCSHFVMKYEACKRKTGVTLIALRPLVPDQVFMPHMEAMYVPFHMRYCSLICYKGLHNERMSKRVGRGQPDLTVKTVRKTIQI